MIMPSTPQEFICAGLAAVGCLGLLWVAKMEFWP